MRGRRKFLKEILGVMAAPAWVRAALRTASSSPIPYIQNVGRQSATVLWTALDHAPWRLRYWPSQQTYKLRTSTTSELQPNDIERAYALYRHKVELSDLSERSPYYYSVDIDDPAVLANDSARFQTNGPGKFSFLAFGDSGTGNDHQRELAARILTEEVALVVHTGDVGQYRGAFLEYENFYFPIYRDLMRRTPFFPTAGNHDYATNNAFALLALHDVPNQGVPAEDRGRYYSFDWSNAHFVCLDSNLPLSRAAEGRGKMLDWLEQDLAASRKFWKIVYFHHPPYTTSIHIDDPQSALARKHIVPILERHGAHLVLNGHEHSYQRSLPLKEGAASEPDKGIVYVTTAGGGGSLYPTGPAPTLAVAYSRHHYLRVTVDGATLGVRAIDASGEALDTFTLAPPPILIDSPVVDSTTLGTEVAPGGTVFIRGRHLAADEAQPAGPSRMTELGGVSVETGQQRLDLRYVSPTLIKAILPMGLSGHATVRVNAPNGSVETGIDLVPAAPGILYAMGPNGEILNSSSRLAPGSSITIYATGLGDVEPAPDGTAAGVARSTRCPVDVLFAGSAFPAGGAVLLADTPGVYQVPFIIPEQFLSGQAELALLMAGRASNSISLRVWSNEQPDTEREPLIG